MTEQQIIELQDFIYAAYKAATNTINKVHQTNVIHEELRTEITYDSQDVIAQLEAICDILEKYTGESFEMWDFHKG